MIIIISIIITIIMKFDVVVLVVSMIAPLCCFCYDTRTTITTPTTTSTITTTTSTITTTISTITTTTTITTTATIAAVVLYPPTSQSSPFQELH